MFKPATRAQTKLRMTIDGPAGSGKTYTALRFAHTLGNKIALIDTERGSASKYAGEAPDGVPWQFDTLELTQFSPERYTEAIYAAGRAGYNVLVIDSLSHAWEGVGGALEIKDRVIDQASNKNQYIAWRSVTPLHNRMVDAMLQAPMHVITTMRSRTEYIQDLNEHGKVIAIRRVGMAPVQRPGMEYEFDLVCDMDWSHIMTVGKSRCSAVADMKIEKPGPEFMCQVMAWLGDGAALVEAAPVFVVTATLPPVITLDDLVNQYGVDAIMQANGGVIPATQDEIDLIALALSM
jgi:hypothetical protein